MATGQGILGNNMFAYCLNNPIIYGDYTGQDAILLLDKDYVGHIGIMAQDEDGTWWHFYWGAAPNYMVLCAFFVDVPVHTWCKKYTGETTLEEINKSGQYSDYEEILYFYGDFSFSAEAMKKATGKYNLYTNNCSQVSLRILAAADTEYKELFSDASRMFIPSDAFMYLKTDPIVVTKKVLMEFSKKMVFPWRGVIFG